MLPRGVVIVTSSPLSTASSRASSIEISQNSAGCSSASRVSVRDMPPAV